MIFKSFNEAKHAYDTSVKLASTWMTHYYRKKNLKYLGVSIEKIQAFSQYYFFSCLTEKSPIRDIWVNYPEIGADDRSLLFKIATRTIGLLKEIVAPTNHFRLKEENYDLLIIANGRHFNDLIELVYFLKSKLKVLVVGKITNEAQDSLQRNNIESVNVLSGRRSQDRLVRLKLVLKYFLMSWDNNDAEKVFGEGKWYSRLWYLRLIQFPEIESLIRLTRQVINLSNSKIVLTSTSNDLFGAAITLTAQSMGIKVAEIQHGITVWKIIESDFYNSDYYLVWGEISKEMHPKNAVIVGSPYFRKSQIKKTFEKSIYSSRRKKLLILWTPPFGSVSIFKSSPNETIFSNLIKGLSKLPTNWEITIRSHPSFSLKDLLNDIKLPLNIEIDNRKSVFESIKLHDLVIIQSTTAGLIAIFQKKLLFYFDSSYLFEKYSDPFVSYNCSLNIPSKDLINIDKYIYRLLGNKQLMQSHLQAQQKFAYKYCACVGKEAFQKISDFIDHAIHV